MFTLQFQVCLRFKRFDMLFHGGILRSGVHVQNL